MGVKIAELETGEAVTMSEGVPVVVYGSIAVGIMGTIGCDELAAAVEVVVTVMVTTS